MNTGADRPAAGGVPARDHRPPTRAHDTVLGLAALVLSLAVCVLALAITPEEAVPGADTFDVELVSAWWSLAWLLVLIPGVAAWFRPLLALWLAGAVVAPQVVTAAVVVARYGRAGEGDGLEAFVFLLPLGMGLLSTMLIAVALVASPHSRARRRTATGPDSGA